ncbi:bifunctional glutamate N-acetyltransferase/amino-acid acetyltransferase ArgJ [bacterium]|nr:bifunctional glutamate N-acetyltransferase/amino-acid acetyltransferase ArgJ [Akkermansiaceae bacterium]MDA8972777.1 bifunctional glutamate N-acetyltransferase/amino-acid acetyltransferase ArgJ [bacterium]MDB4421983.1 bifunctional glutamate N-acetyltransferase/amino-acid acetyltransferase ArgJ [Akkermansiaceae bacterium]MDB4578395.1 bifunctional glutamate N-acetyltransferase/amino-acid acetyltransferase ArgJ [Akkermansiaceae bacterium]
MDIPYSRIKGGVCAPRGFHGSAVSCGIKDPSSDRLDLSLLYSAAPCLSAGAFTQNRVKAAPVRMTQSHLRANPVRAIISNSGNANACTGVTGLADARTMARSTAKLLGIRQREVAVASTGVIGIPLPMMRIEPKFEELVAGVAPKKGNDIARSIITSDTHEKEVSISYEFEGSRIRIGGCAKGAGMINPNMATMLCYITTDANLGQTCLDRAVQDAVQNTFNRITIDGDTSTNDTVLVLANGEAGNKVFRRGSKGCKIFSHALQFVMNKLAKAIVRDGERVTKFVTVEVKGARTKNDAKKVAEAVANSSLVKASWNGEDPNWGRIIHAVGYSGASVREEMIDIYFDKKEACAGGLQAKTNPEVLRNIVKKKEFTITIDLNRGSGDYHIYASDLSPEYVDFNRSEYAYWKQAQKDGVFE